MDRFSRLETLSLEQNNIAGEEIFAFLSIVPRLRNLNLSHNKITGFPESALTLEEKRGAGFYSLMYLNLAHNLITSEEAVLFTCELHSLRKLVLYGNPLAHAAVFSYDHTKLAYDPVPSVTAHIAESELGLEIVIGYPETKRKKRTSMTCYENVEIYKMIPNETLLHPPFRTKATNFMLAENDQATAKRVGVATEPEVVKPSVKQFTIDTSDTTFLTGVGIEDVLGAAVSTRSPSEAQPMKTRSAINALRYQLEHPLTSHDDSELFPTSSQRPTQAHLQRQRPRQHHAESTTPQNKVFFSALGSANNSTSSHRKHKGARAVDDALAELSDQVAKTWGEKRSNSSGERKVDFALDSLVSTAQKINLTYQQQPASRAHMSLSGSIK